MRHRKPLSPPVESPRKPRAPVVAPQAAALLQLQRSAGNRAATAVVQQARGPLLQRVGEDKLSFVAKTGADQAELESLRLAIASLNNSQEKTSFEQTQLANMGTAKDDTSVRNRQIVVMQDYTAVLDKGDSLERLLKTEAFTSGALKLANYVPGQEFYDVLGKGETPIAFLSVGEASHIPDLENEDEPPRSERVTLTKLDKPLQEYV